MSLAKKYRLIIASIIVVVGGILLFIWGYNKLQPLPELTEFKTSYFHFIYPRAYTAKEYAPGVVSIGNQDNDGINPLVEVVRYQSDPDIALPATFDAFMKRQAAALCGADGPIESISCTQVGVTPYTNPLGVKGNKLDLALVRTNLRSGTTTNSTYGPIYVFDTSGSRASSTPEDPFRYSAIFIYPSLSAFINLGTTSPQILNEVVNSYTPR
jgi:hypothetical protein